MCTPKIKVLVVDDHPVVAEGTISWLSSDPKILVLGTAHNGEECIHIVSNKKPDIVLLPIFGTPGGTFKCFDHRQVKWQLKHNLSP